MSWDEFSDLLSGLNEQTPLVRVAQIRLEKDPKRIKEFTPEQRRMRQEWQKRRAQSKPASEQSKFLATMQEAFKRMF